jgi:PAS domain S-box-containing protein
MRLDDLERPRILLVDDEPKNLRLLEAMLAPDGFLLETASSGEGALALVARQAPDLILLDVMMPGMDGYEVTRRLKEDQATKGIPVIMVTAIEDRGAKLRGLSAGAEDFLSKPVDRLELGVRVRNLIRLKTLGDYHARHSGRLELEVGRRAAELVESEARFRQLAESIDEVFFLVDPPHTTMFYLSPAFERIFGRSRTSVYADPLSWSESIPPDERTRVLSEIMPSGTMIPFDTEYRIVRPDGSERFIRARSFPITNAAGEVYRFAGLAGDVTERRRLEAQSRQASKMDAIGQLASGVAHDFNNLLSIILSYSEMLAGDLKQGDRMRGDLEEIHSAGLRAVALTRQLLAFSRQQVLKPQVVNLNEIVGGMERMLRRLLGEDVELSVRCGSEAGKILVDPGQLEQVLMNLAVNARDAMPQGGQLTVETADLLLDHDDAAYAEAKPAHIVMAVSDTGTGMAPETQARLFEPFFTTKEPGKGTGLGLSTVFGIVKQSGGTIGVESEVGKGTTFKVYFPAALGPATAHVSQFPTEMSARGSETVLVVEDEESVRSLVCAILRKHGYNVVEAQSAGDAFLLCEQHAATIHLLLTDVVMPRMSGRQLAERLVTLRPAMRVLYMSGYTHDAVARHGVVDSTIAFLQKPITPDALVRTVRRTLDANGKGAP